VRARGSQRKKTVDHLKPERRCAGDTGMVITAGGTVPSRGLAQAVIGDGAKPALWLAPEFIGGLASPPRIGRDGTGKAVPRLG